MKPAPFDYVRAHTVAEAVAALAAEGAKVLAGGQSLGPMLNLRLARPSLLVDVSRIPELRAIEERTDAVVYGAGLTHSAFEDRLVPDPTGGALAEVAAGIAYRAVRNRGTIGGSLVHADPAADWPTLLTALGALIRIEGPSGRREVAMAEFSVGAFESALGSQEILTAVIVPRPSASARWGYWKHCRRVGEFAEAMAAVLDDPERGVCRLTIGATHGRPILISKPEPLRPAEAEGPLAEAGLAADPVAFQMHRTAVRRAIARARA